MNSNVMMLEFTYLGEEEVALFDQRAIDEKSVRQYLRDYYPMDRSDKVVVMRKSQFLNVFHFDKVK